jgi:uncharacterized protein
MWRHLRDGIEFEWDPEKAAANLDKHGVAFEEASEVFFDPFLVTEDATREHFEERIAVIGMSRRWRMLFVVHVERNERLRSVSARPTTTAERKRYEDG